jgi:ABC-type sugar transport system ATPase subunit
VRFGHPAEALEAGLALVTEDRKRLGLFDQLGVVQNITLCALRDAVRLGLVQPSRERQQAMGMVERLRVKTPGLESAITNLSGGNQQKCLIARGLLTQPRLLLLDDPTRGVDVGAKAELYQLIDELCRQGLAVIVTSSELPELLTLSDRIYVLCEGRVTGHFLRDEASRRSWRLPRPAWEPSAAQGTPTPTRSRWFPPEHQPAEALHRFLPPGATRARVPTDLRRRLGTREMARL